MAAATNYYKLSGLRQHTFMMLHFWSSEVHNESYGSRINMAAGLHFFPGSRGESVSLPELPEAAPFLGSLPPSSGSKAPGFSPSHTMISLVRSLLCPSFFSNDPHPSFGPTWGDPGSSPHLQVNRLAPIILSATYMPVFHRT